ncbi:nuclear pore complex subunit [Scheffersomyces stipitis CBS 6054]|uniref:Nuclear pore complex subunit n=1 Tax=Scheffersomyces stipitis (strain ATCC 58785 / CBS 6054 / NBRC 10063 / NRRL Y-11545) TaxID=322104 RepID=A3GFV1_PICST|nr:nuclear pore complex subunit [Scheffersomyces stipitis CBS 6054]EAZ63407.2 nuclear pore complex subunit [Scheffersomyces stipitis CBS 6054]
MAIPTSVPLNVGSSVPPRPTDANSKYIAPTLKLKDVSDSLQFHQDRNSSSMNSSRGNLSKRFLHPMSLDAKEVNYKINVPNFANLPPLQLGSKFITDLNKIDSLTPSDLYYGETINKTETGLDNYYFDYDNGLGEFSRFEKINQLNLPDKFFDEYNSTECITKQGMFPEIERSWIAIDNKLVLWNYKVPQSSFNQSSQFLTIDQIRHTILTVKLVKPKPGVFVPEVNYLLVVATTIDIHIFIIKYDSSFNNLEIFNPDLSISSQGLIVNNFTVNPKTNDIYFSGEGDGINIWRLDYSNKSSFIKNKCDKICLTKSGLSSVIPNKLPGLGLFDYSETSNNDKSTAPNNIPELLVQLEVDPERDILYSLSNKSIIRVYKLQPKQEQLHEASRLTPNQIFKSASSLFVDTANIKVFERFKVISIQHISPQESGAVQLIAITSNGCRILLKLGSSSTFGSLISSSFASSSLASAMRLNLATIKFPPSRDVPVINPELDSFTRNKQYLAQLVANQQKSQLLKNTKIAKVISPGVFICVKKTKKSDKLFIATANYGFLKKNNKLVEDAEFIKYGANDDTSFTYINDIIQLTPSMNATNTPNGYANVLASQYTKQPLRFALLTNFGIIIYQFKLTDQILKTLKEETIENFIEENGFEETCSTLLYLSCSYGHHNSNDLFKRKAQILFSTCGNSARLTDSTQLQTHQNNALLPHQQQLANIGATSESHPTVDQVVLSDRFYGTCLLISRLFRECWNKNVFVKLPHIKSNTLGEIEVASVKEDNLLIKGLNIDKKQVEFFIGSIIVLIDFFVENGNSIQGLNAPNYSSDPSQFESEVCLRAEHIAFTSIIKSLNSMKEALSFLMVLIEEIQINQSNFNDIFKFLSLTNQVNLLSLSFKDLLLPNREVKNLIKDLLSSIINKNILKGGSIDLIASSLQGRCGSFCSTDDVLIFKAIENLTRAKNIGYRDAEIKSKCLKNAVILFEEAHESLTLENIENSVNIMLDLEYYVGAVGLLLKLAHKVGSNPKIPNAQFDQINAHDNSKKNTRAIEDNKKRSQLFNLVFKILTSVDSKAIKITETNNQLLINEFIEVRDSAYESCFASQDKAFHYEFYQWFIDQGVSERLLEIDTPFILPFLEERSEKTLALSDLLWLYHSKREHYFEAASILYSLAISEFALNLNQRIEYLSRANGFCNCVCPPNLRQKMIQLSSVIQELFDVANVQLDILAAINSDSRISKENKDIATSALNFKILTISDLFNTYADPLGYYDLCLLIFKISDYKNTDDILKRWELFFEKIFHEFLVKNKSSSEAFYILVNKAFSLIGSRLSSNDLVFPIDELIKLISKYLQEAIEENPVSQKPPKGAIIDMFVKSGVGYDKLYYVIKSLIEHNTFEIYPGFTNDLKTNEMAYLIKNWYNSDKKLRELISSDKIRKLEDYSLEVDPISDLVKHGGVLF